MIVSIGRFGAHDLNSLLKILLLGDCSSSRDTVRRVLGADRVLEASNAQEAIAMLEQQPVSCLLFCMGRHNEVGARELAELSSYYGKLPAPAVAIIDRDSEHLAQAALAAGAHDYLHSSRVDQPMLAAVIKHAQSRFAVSSSLESSQEQLQEQNSSKTQFVANATHELRTPLSAIVGLVSFLREEPLTERGQQLATTITSCCDSLLLSVDDILDLASLESGRFVLHPAPLQVQRNVSLVIDALRPLAQAKGLDLEADLPQDLPRVIGDAGRIRQLLYNLASNALKFTNHGTVAVRVHRTERTTPTCLGLRFEVRDTGEGIAFEEQRAIFERRYRARRRGRGSRGTGLGLSIVRDLVKEMGGQLGVESEPGVGSTFWFELDLPVTAGDESLDNELRDAGKSQSLPPRNLRVLVAEDNPLIAEILRKQLEDLGHRPTLVRDGAQAIKQATAEEFDLALFDARMPVVDGLTASAEIRARPQNSGKRLPIIILTAEAQLERTAWQQAGADACLIKPVPSTVLDRTFASLLAT